MSRTFAIAAAALALSLPTAITSATESLPSRAMSVLGVAIASQGDAALDQIRRELSETAREAMKPFLPEAPKAPEQQPPADKPAATR